MDDLKFIWNEHKNRMNQKKHGVSFEEAQTVFLDDYARLIHDPDHSEDEDRYILVGLSCYLRILAVCHCYSESSDLIRIISARKASKFEKRQYERYSHER